MVQESTTAGIDSVVEHASCHKAGGEPITAAAGKLHLYVASLAQKIWSNNNMLSTSCNTAG
jgi:hypothetical protein